MTYGFHFWYRYLFYCLQRALLSRITLAPAEVGVGLLTDAARSRTELIAENAFLRQQVVVLQRSVKRPLPTPRDRFLLVVLASKVRSGNKSYLLCSQIRCCAGIVTCFAGCGVVNQRQ